MKNQKSGSSAPVARWGGSPARFILHNSYFIIPLLLLSASLLIYLPVLRGGFIWDDDILITRNPLILAPGGLPAIWQGKFNPDYFPLTSTLFWLEYRLWGADAPAYHLVNVLLHGGAAILLWRLLRSLRVPWAWAGALLFAVHPVAVGTVAWIAEGKNTLSLLLALASALFYAAELERPGGRFFSPRAAASLACFLLALLAKTSVVMLPLVLLLIVWWKKGKITPHDFLRSTPYFALSLAMGLITMRFQALRAIGGADVPLGGFAARTGASVKALAYYAFHLLLPLRLVIIHPPLASGLPVAAQVVLLIGMVALAWQFRRTRPGRGFLFGFAAFTGMLLPILGWAKMYYFVFSPVADHLAYVGLPAVTALVAGGAGHFAQGNPRYRLPTGVAAGLLAACFACTAWTQAGVYRDAGSLWSRAVKQNPGSFQAQSSYALVLLDEGRLGEAIQHAQLAARENPGFLRARLNLGLMYDRAGQLNDALSEYTLAVGMAPAESDPHLALGHVLIEAGDNARAIDELRQGLRIDSSDAGGHNNLGLALEKAGRMDPAIDEYRNAANLEPDSEVYRRNLAVLLFRAGRMTEAAVEFGTLVRIQPGSADYHNDYGAALREAGRQEEAGAQFREALRLDPTNQMARENLSRLETGATLPVP